MFGIFKKRVNDEDVIKASFISACELYKVQQKSGGMLSDPKNIEAMYVTISQKDFQIEPTPYLVNYGKTIAMTFLMEEKFIADIVKRDRSGTFEGLTDSDLMRMREILKDLIK